MSRYVYIVTRIVKDDSPYVTHIPNLGVHSSEKKAFRHFLSVVKDRGGTRNDTTNCTWGDDSLLFTYHMKKGTVDETVRLEKWKVK